MQSHAQQNPFITVLGGGSGSHRICGQGYPLNAQNIKHLEQSMHDPSSHAILALRSAAIAENGEPNVIHMISWNEWGE